MRVLGQWGRTRTAPDTPRRAVTLEIEHVYKSPAKKWGILGGPVGWKGCDPWLLHPGEAEGSCFVQSRLGSRPLLPSTFSEHSPSFISPSESCPKGPVVCGLPMRAASLVHLPPSAVISPHTFFYGASFAGLRAGALSRTTAWTRGSASHPPRTS